MSHESKNWAAQDWEDLIPRLLLLAVVRLSRPALQDGGPGAPVRASEAQGYVDEAVSKTLAGDVAGIGDWDPNTHTLFEYLARIVVRDIDEVVGSQLRRAGADGAQEIEESQRQARRGLLDHLYDRNERLGEMASLMLLENCLDTTELADALEVVPVEITNLRRRMKQEVRDYIAGHGA